MTLPKILRTKIVPPQRSPRILPRARVCQALAQALNYRLTLLLAGAGYGKSTALADLAEESPPLIWYQVTEEDSDLQVFLLHLCHATQEALPELEGLPTAFLESWDGSQGALPSQGVLNQYLNALNENLTEPTLLALDDAPLVMVRDEIALLLDRLIGLAPPHLHVVLAGRPPVKLPNLARWRARGEVLTIDQGVLAFNAEEIFQLFTRQYGYELTSAEVAALQAYTEGWAIALQLVWQNLRIAAAAPEEPPSLMELLPLEGSPSTTAAASSPDALFEILAREVYERQPADVQEFLLVSATLREMTAAACDALRRSEGAGQNDSAAMLGYLRRQELFVVEQSDGSLRYHHIFHDFLRQLAAEEQRWGWHARAAEYYQRGQNADAQIYHLLQGRMWEPAAHLLESYGDRLLAGSRPETLAAHLDALPPETLRQHPTLLFYLGEVARMGSRFQEALGWYQQAESIWRARGQPVEVGRALRGQARVYLDTVDPSKAEELLERAIRLSDGIEDRDAEARLYELLAENKLNAGQVEEAERLRQKALSLRNEGPSDSALLLRVLLRTGRLEEARRNLEALLLAERQQPVHTPRAHRETLLLLSLLDAFQGRGERAYRTAREGTQRGAALNSAFITAVGHMRQGHALMLPDSDPALSRAERYDLARQHYEKSVEISRSLAVSRLRVEANWGLCRTYGYQGDLAQALKVAQDGIEIAVEAGDEWVASLVRLAMGAGLVLAARYESADDWLNQAARYFQECSDPFGRCAARLWQCLAWHRQGNNLRCEQALPEVLAVSQERDYDYLFTRPTLLGPPEVRALVPLLILARERGWEGRYAARLLAAIGLPGIKLHPGYRLRVQTLGGFQLWRGEVQAPTGSWRREKARHLFQIMLSQRETPLDRDQLAEYLWPEQKPAKSQRNFRIALNALYHVLEPEREPGSESAYVERVGTTYGLRPEADLWIDAQDFEETAHSGLQVAEKGSLNEAVRQLEAAVALYQGEYLPEARYENWAAAERERLAVLFLQTADRLSSLLLERDQPERAIRVCERILAQDNCWERAYRQLMLAYDRLGNRGQVARAYQRCWQNLERELEVAPSAETQALYHELTQREAAP